MTFTVWFTGLPSSGKTTVGELLAERLNAILLDGDVFRKTISKGLGFSKEDRFENLRRASVTARFLNDSGRNVVACFITPYEEVRREIGETVGTVFWVYTSCPLKVCMKRDVKGLYKKAKRGEIKDFTGVSAGFYPPSFPDVTLKTNKESPEQSVNKVLKKLDERGLWKVKATLFIGRFSPPHRGHKYIFDSVLNNGGKIVIAVRDTPFNRENPYTSRQREIMLENLYKDNPNVQVITIPDVDMVCVGRGVGYKIMSVPDNIVKVSASKIRGEKKFDDIPSEIRMLVKHFNQKNRVVRFWE